MAKQATRRKPAEKAEEVEWSPPLRPDPVPLEKAEHLPEVTEKQVVANFNKWGPKDSARRREIILETLSQGYSAQTAANRAGVSRRLIFMWMEKDADFKAQCHEAMESGIDLMEDEALRRATQGVQKPIYQQGMLVGYVTEYSDKLLEMNLKARRPGKYRERVDVNQTGKFTIVQSKEDDDLL